MFLQYAGFDAMATIEAPATTMLSACAIVTMPEAPEDCDMYRKENGEILKSGARKAVKTDVVVTRWDSGFCHELRYHASRGSCRFQTRLADQGQRAAVLRKHCYLWLLCHSVIGGIYSR